MSLDFLTVWCFDSQVGQKHAPIDSEPRNGVWIEIFAEHWGMTMRQIKQLMNECKETREVWEVSGLVMSGESSVIQNLPHLMVTTSLCAKEDPDWRQNNSVRDMVKNHILPRTAGTGLGYLAEIFALRLTDGVS